MSDASLVLGRLINAAEAAISMRRMPDEALQDDLAAMQQPVGVIFSGAHGLLAQALAIAERARHTERHGRLLMIVGVLLPLVREDLSAIIEARRQPLGPDVTERRGR